jgi:pyridine nucleotide-disulfide oxidoreductase
MAARGLSDSTAIQAGDDVLEGRYVVVAAGAKPARLKIPGEDLLTTSDQFLELNALPRGIVFVGGGYISFEFAHVAARAGARKAARSPSARSSAAWHNCSTWLQRSRSIQILPKIAMNENYIRR